MQKFCEQCGSVLKPGDKFCVSCGAEVPETNNSQPTQNSTRPSSNKNAKIFIPIVLIVSLIGVGVGVWAGMEYFKTEDKVVTETQKPPENVSVKPTPTNIPEPVVSAPAPLGIEWIQDINTGIYLKNPEPTDGESITWSGGYVQDGQYKLADGYGVINWYRYGELKQVDEGTFIKGERNGNFKHKFYPSGNVSYSNWDHGVEIVNKSNSGEVYVGNYSDGTAVYLLTESVSYVAMSTQTLAGCACKVRAGRDYLSYSFSISPASEQYGDYSNSEGYEGNVFDGKSPVARAIFDYVTNH